MTAPAYSPEVERTVIQRFTFVPTGGADDPWHLVTLGMGGTLGTFPTFDAAFDAACELVLKDAAS